jgi:outer membrane biogenesis lipoprotein LolB
MSLLTSCRLVVGLLLASTLTLTACSSPAPRPDPRPGLRQRDKQQQRELDRYAPPKVAARPSATGAAGR